MASCAALLAAALPVSGADLVLLNWLGLTRGPLGIPAIPGPEILGIDLGTPARQYYLVLALVVLATVVVSRLVNSTFGEAIQAIREDEVAAEALGVPTTRLKVVTFTLAAALAGVAGAFFAHYATFVSPGSFTLVVDHGQIARGVAPQASASPTRPRVL